MDNENHWCFSWFEEDDPKQGTTRAALVKDFKWKSGEQIKISFLDGDPSVQERVKKVALQWVVPGIADVRFAFQKDPGTIRISFKNPGSWSVIGTSCKKVTDKSRPTMNYGWLTPSSGDQEVERVVLHEFGHALGLIHEHQNPGGKINWNRAAVIRDLSGPPNNWSLDVIERNMFEPWDAAEVNATNLDPDSIMMYPIPKNWTTDGFSVGLNSKLSARDKKFIQEQYK